MAVTTLSIEQRHLVIQKAMQSPDFRALLIKDPRAAIKQAINLDVADGVTIDVIEEKTNEYIMVMPATAG